MGEITRLVKSGVGVEIAFTELGGWNTHANQGGSSGRIAGNLQKLAEGIVAFYRDPGDRMEDVILLTLSKFGRTVKENGYHGTDHGHANIIFVLGVKVQGGKVYGRWPGLEPELLYEGRDPELTTDYRHVCDDVLHHHLGVRNFSYIIPGPATLHQPIPVEDLSGWDQPVEILFTDSLILQWQLPLAK